MAMGFSMVLFLPMQQELDCINSDGQILGKIRFDDSQKSHLFYKLDESIELEKSEVLMISERLSGLDSGTYSIPMQDDD